MPKRPRTPDQDEPQLFPDAPEGPCDAAGAGTGGSTPGSPTLGARPDAPLADRMRPSLLSEMVGQRHIAAPDSLLGRAIADLRIPSMILWGPPGSGKTTLAHILEQAAAHASRDGMRIRFAPFSAVLGGLPELRTLLDEAERFRRREGGKTLLFIDEIHRFHKGQQDAFLPHVERGTVTLIGATTENPSFAINAALLSRSKVFHLEPLSRADLVALLRRALLDEDRGLGRHGLTANDQRLALLAEQADGDARRALTTLELAAGSALSAGRAEITDEDLSAANERAPLLYDKRGEEHYNVISAFIKSMRGSDPDAAIYWMMRMLEAGEDPLFVLRRMIILASEDIGNADPRALELAIAADHAFRRLGMPEGMYPLAHACLYLASAPKSNSVTRAWQSAQEAVREHGSLPVPRKLRNAATALLKSEGYGKDYRYAHDFEGHVVPGEVYLPDALTGQRFYEPTSEGLEKAIGERLARIRKAT